MSKRAAQFMIFWLILIALIATVGSLYLGYYRLQYYAEEFQSLVAQSLALFAGPISIAVGGYFATRSTEARERVSVATLMIAIVCCMAWMTLTAGRTLLFVTSPDEKIPVLVAWYSQVVTGAAFLINGVLAFLFASAQQKGRERLPTARPTAHGQPPSTVT